MLSSRVVIEGPPALLLVDASRNLAGWEAEFCDRLCAAMVRRGLRLVGGRSLRVSGPEELGRHLPLLEAANCLLLIGHGGETSPSASAELREYWAWLRANAVGPKLLAVCSWADHDPAFSEEVLRASGDFAPLALVQESPVSGREGGLFFLKFFTELHLHSEVDMTGRMAWFSWSKATALLKRRRLTGSFGLRT